MTRLPSHSQSRLWLHQCVYLLIVVVAVVWRGSETGARWSSVQAFSIVTVPQRSSRFHCATPTNGRIVTAPATTSLASTSTPTPPSASSSSSSTDTTPSTPSPRSQTTSDGPATVDWDWRRVASTAFATSSKPIILFDGVCNFCNAGVNRCLDWDAAAHDGVFRYASLQSRTGQALLLQHGKRANDISSIVVVTPTRAWFESDAVLFIATQLEGLPRVLRATANLAQRIVPRWTRDGLYQVVANNRYIFGEQDQADGPSCRLDLDGNLQARFVDDPEL